MTFRQGLVAWVLVVLFGVMSFVALLYHSDSRDNAEVQRRCERDRENRALVFDVLEELVAASGDPPVIARFREIRDDYPPVECN